MTTCQVIPPYSGQRGRVEQSWERPRVGQKKSWERPLVEPSRQQSQQEQQGHWACDICSRSFPTYAQAFQHERQCGGGGRWLCEYCDAGFPTYQRACQHEATCPIPRTIHVPVSNRSSCYNRE